MSTRALLVLCILLALCGWIAVALFTYHNPPDALNRWILLALLWPTLLATCLPLVYSIHRRRGAQGAVAAAATRQSAFAATYVTLCLWLRMIQALNWTNMLLMLLLFVATEVLLSTRQP